MGEPYQEINLSLTHGHVDKKAGLKERKKKTKTKYNNQGLIPCVLKFYLHTGHFPFFLFFFSELAEWQTSQIANTCIQAMTTQLCRGSVLNEAACCFLKQIS